ncbi:uncharacterized protein K452DRAFT_19547 [Aplosporella prunicola CBS 121167]|uniref:Uncharacterized protein n=1 Tax=Aplosporella prunicola CBS 121167 TaxID=1176127 RepID=A0A6A6BE83_9PEZI|nr:uncharacterized protein K452DRAFT_19547 [Aplosporella prunicola CBS 121167]KAF2142479.1 hypothetical protein K452DRAFT_19547 [Aplosporella prunicola CBS 121167]
MMARRAFSFPQQPAEQTGRQNGDHAPLRGIRHSTQMDPEHHPIERRKKKKKLRVDARTLGIFSCTTQVGGRCCCMLKIGSHTTYLPFFFFGISERLRNESCRGSFRTHTEAEAWLSAETGGTQQKSNAHSVSLPCFSALLQRVCRLGTTRERECLDAGDAAALRPLPVSLASPTACTATAVSFFRTLRPCRVAHNPPFFFSAGPSEPQRLRSLPRSVQTT